MIETPYKGGITAFHKLASLAFILCLFFTTFALAATPKFPELKGRVVDSAHQLSSYTKRELETILSGLEKETTDQLVVVMLPSLQGFTIEDFGYQLGRHWGIGQKGKDNGILLIVAPAEHKVRIEVGYGLEGTVTDAASSVIINTVMLPMFRQGKMGEGVLAGAQSIIAVLGGQSIADIKPPESAEVSQPQPAPPPIAQQQGGDMPGWLVALLIFIVFILCIRYPSFATYMLLNMLTSSYRGGSSRIGGGGGGFKGGGGSFGGGGSSGSW